MNLLGISWGMGARDVGMKAAVTGAQNNLDNINDSLEKQSKIAAKSKMPGFWESIKQFNIGSIAQGVRDLTGDTGNLTNSLEAMGVANAKAAKPFVASLNLSGKAARKMTAQISGMAIGLNVGAETVAQTFKSMAQATGPAKEALDALGWSQKDWVKITETTGIKIDDMTDAMGGLGAWWQATAKDEAAFVNRLADIGRKAGVGMEPLKKLKGNLEGLAKTFEKVPPAMRRSGDEMMALSESGVRLSGAFREMGSSEEEAVELGQKTVQMFADQSVAVEQAMKYGIGSLDDSPLFKWLTSVGVGMDEAVSIIDTGSRDAVKGTQLLQGVFDRFGKGGAQQQAMLSQLSGALGDAAGGLGYLAQRGDLGAKSLERVSKITTDGKFSLKDYADQAFSSGRSLQESLDLMKSSFETKFRSIARKDVVRFVGEMGQAYKTIGNQAKELASDETWGPLIKRLSAVNQLGAKGLFLNFGKSNKQMAAFSAMMDVGGGALNSLAASIGPAVAMISQLGLILGPITKMFGGFFGKLGLVGIAIGAVAVGLKMLSGRGIDLSGVFAKLLKWAGGLFDKIKEFLSKINWANVGKTLGGFILDALTFVPKAIWGWLTGSEAKTELGSAGEGFIESLGGAILEAAKGLGKMLINMGGEIIDGVTEWWDSWTWDDVKQSFEDMGKNIKEWWAELQQDPELQEFNLNIREGLEDAGWAIKDWFSELPGKFDKGTERLADYMNMRGVGEESGKSFTEGVADGIRSATNISETVKLQSNNAMMAAADAVRNYDPSEVDAAYATTAAHWISRTSSLSSGMANSITGFFKGAIGQAGNESNASIATFFSNMFKAAKDGVNTFALKFIHSMQELGTVVKDTFFLLMHPEELEKREKEMAAKAAKDRAAEMQGRLSKVKGEVALRTKLHKEIADSYKEQAKYSMEAFQIGKESVDPVTGKKKKKKTVASEQQWMSDEWSKQSDAITSAAQAKAAAQTKLEKLQSAVGTRGPGAAVSPQEAEALSKAKIDLAAAESGLKGVEAAVMQSAKKAGIRGDALQQGVRGAMDMVLKMEEERVRSKAAMDDAQQRLSAMETEAGAASAKAAALVGANFNNVAAGATDAGIAVIEDFGAGLANPESVTYMDDQAFDAAQSVADFMTAQSPIADGPLGGVGSGGEADPAWLAGRTLMESLAEGITSGVDVVADAVTNALDESVLASFEAYNAEMKKIASKKSLLNEVAGMLMRDFGSKIESTITIEGKTSNVKENMKAMLSVPGIAGVTMAIINESAKQMKILDKIREHTETIAKSDLVAKGKATGATYTLSS